MLLDGVRKNIRSPKTCSNTPNGQQPDNGWQYFPRVGNTHFMDEVQRGRTSIDGEPHTDRGRGQMIERKDRLRILTIEN